MSLFLSVFIYWKGASGFLLLYETRGEIHKVFSLLMLQAPFGSSQALLLESLVFHNRSKRSSTRLTSDVESHTAHTVVTLITTSRLAAALIRGSLGLSWLRMCKMVYPQWWFRIVLSLLLCRPPPLLATPWGLEREPRAPVLLFELSGSPKSFDFS